MTPYTWACPVRMTTGAGALRAVLAEERAAGRACLVVLDAGVARTPFAQSLDRWLRESRVRQAAPVHLVEDARVGADAVSALAARLAATDAQSVIAVGGGSVMDLVKLAALAACSPSTLTAVTDPPGRAGAIVLPDTGVAGLRRILVPTTVGTGSEVSAVACLTTGGTHRLVLGPALRADAAVLEPEASASLPRALLLEGVLEALLRVAGPFIGSRTGAALPDAAAGLLVGELVWTGERMAAGDLGAAARLYAAELSAHTHTGAPLLGRDPVGARLWYLANALSAVVGVRKMVATAALLPAYLARVQSGDARFGSNHRLGVLWAHVQNAGGAPRGLEPVEGFRRLLLRWGVDHELSATDGTVARIAHAAVRSWGGGLPMLGGLRFDDVSVFLRDALRAPAERSPADA